MPKTEEKTATVEQRAAAYQAIQKNPAITNALRAAGISFETFAANSAGTLERLEEYKAARR